MLSRSWATVTSLLGDLGQSAALYQTHGGVDDCFCSEAVDAAVLKPKNVTGQVECADLSPSVGEELVTAHRAVDDLIDVFGKFGFTKNLGATTIFEFVQDNLGLRQITKLTEKSRLLWARLLLKLTNIDHIPV